MSILTTRINFLDFALSNYYINIFFTIFCILIVVNGANLIDGLNGLVLGYFFIVFFFLFKLNFFTLYFFSEEEDAVEPSQIAPVPTTLLVA
jgi:UDP-N-acetylmuramyl pentapeptide phosphotransferase/UDP-N-acetylglucosamine-1-phosphate transferase